MDDGISIIIPTYNNADLLPRAIKSVLNQTYTNFELIIVDDASTDNTREVVENYIQKDSRVKYYKHKENKERSAARNTGIKYSTKPFLAFLDSDDKWLPTKLEKQILYLKKKGKEWIGVYCNRKIIGIGNSSIYPITFRKNIPVEGGRQLIKSVLLQKVGSFSSTILIRKEIIQITGGFNESFILNEDFEFTVRLLKKGKLAYIDEKLAIIYKHSNSVSADFSAKVKNKLLDRFKKEVKFFEKEGFPISTVQYLRIAKFYYLERKFYMANKYLFKALSKLHYCKVRNINIIILELISVLKHFLNGLKNCL